jgi:hypothetical protein
VAYGGLRALDFINKALSSGVEIASGHYGFPLLYDLLTGTVAFKLHPNDRPFNWVSRCLGLDFIGHTNTS